MLLDSEDRGRYEHLPPEELWNVAGVFLTVR
jgi:hypothetical protein